eukprot:TRINITY_DN4792_c0_g2_i1.p1 TRINITY_DN4792_c0_g2~~TRINITY_DN4792_c0_g2_i1.p1  ORF type:complete len:179 (+),score=63.24 TRINITY_DN4792_c0_g2_i1:129-665(+)
MSGKKSGGVFDRLTDTSKYSGTHKERFDESGKGKGLAGRADLVKNDGSTSSAARDHSVDKTGPAASGGSRKPVVAGDLGKQKFGTQATKPRTVYVFRNGDKFHTGEKVTIKTTFRTFEQLLEEFTKVVKLVTGPVKKVYKPNMKTRVKSLDDFEDGGKYLCVGGEAPITDKVPKALTE